MSLSLYLERVASRQHLSPEEADAAMQSILSGQASQAQIAAFLVALRMKGETVGRTGRIRTRHAADGRAGRSGA